MVPRIAAFVAFCLLATTLFVAAPARADIYQWEWVIPTDPSGGKEPSTTLCPGGTGASAVASANLAGLNLTQAYLIGVNLQNANLASAVLTNADLSGAVLTNAHLTDAVITGAQFRNSNITVGQLYSTASYRTKDLRGICLAGTLTTPKDLTGCDFTGQT